MVVDRGAPFLGERHFWWFGWFGGYPRPLSLVVSDRCVHGSRSGSGSGSTSVFRCRGDGRLFVPVQDEAKR